MDSRSPRLGVVVESVSCLHPGDAEPCALAIVPVPYSFGDREYLDGVDLTESEFYAELQRRRRSPVTSAPSPAAYLQAFRTLRTPEVLCLTVSRRVSTTAERCLIAIEEAKHVLPDRKIVLVDSGTAGMAQGLLALRACQLAVQGLSLEEIVAGLEYSRQHAHLFIFLDTVHYLATTGRLRRIAALAGGALQIKPVVHVHNGNFQVTRITRSRRQAIDTLLEQVVVAVRDRDLKELWVQHAYASEEGARLAEEVQRRFPGLSVRVRPFSAVMGAYAGPGLLGFAWLDGLA